MELTLVQVKCFLMAVPINNQLFCALYLLRYELWIVLKKDKNVNRLPENAGKSWDESEDRMLCIEFESGLTIMQLAQKHRRTSGAIQSRPSVICTPLELTED